MKDNFKINSNDTAKESEDEIDLRALVGTLIDARLWISAFVAIVFILGIIVALSMTPAYRVNSTVQVEDNSAGGLSSSLTDLSGLLEGKAQATTEMELIHSRMVLGKTVDDLSLNVSARPHYFFILGRLFAPKQAPLFQVGRFDIPDDLVGTSFKVVILEHGQYSIESSETGLIAHGVVGKALRFRTSFGPIEIFVRDIDAPVGQVFKLIKNNRLTTIEKLAKDIDLIEQGKLSGIIQITYESEDKLLAVKTLNQIANNYVRQNVERKSAEAQKTLQFLDQQLPEIKKQLEASEVRVNEFRKRTGTVDVTKEGELLLQQAVAADTGVLELQQKRKELMSRFTESHPSVIAIDKQIAAVKTEQGRYTSQVGALPETEQEMLRLMRDFEVNQALYTELLNNSQQLKVVQAGTVGNVRVIDYAEVPLKPFKPQLLLISAGSIFLGLILGVASAFIRQSLRSGVKEASHIEAQLGISVLATIPASDAQEQLAKKRQKTGGHLNILAEHNGEDLAIESLRSLRTSISFALLDVPNNIIMITGPSPSVGKSFISVNFAAVLASAGLRVLVIDGDLRRGYINEYFGAVREGGVSELIAGTLGLSDGVRSTAIQNLDYISTGVLPPNPAELLLHPRFKELLEELSQKYDHILIDSPPVLAVTDAAIIGRLAGATLLVARFAQTEMRELELSCKRLQQAAVPVKGVLLNRVASASAYGYGYKYAYAYHYSKRTN